MKCVVSGGRGSGNRAASTTFYGTFVGLHGATSAPTEADWQGAMPIAGDFSRFMVHVTVNTRGASTYTFRVNGADGNQSLSVGASTTGWFVDSTNTDTVAVGDLVNYKVVTGAGGSSFQDHVVGAVFNVANSNVSLMGLHDAVAFSVASTTSPLPIHGAPQTAGTETDLQLRFWRGGVLDRLYTHIRANTRSDATTLKSRVNGADGNLSISIAAATTGVFSDTTNSDTIAGDDLVNLALVTGAGTGSITPRTTYVVFTATERDSYFHCAGQGLSVNANLTRYANIQYLSSQNATENLMTTQAGVSGTYVSHLRVYVGTNTVTASSTVKLRRGAADAGPTVSIGSTATGEFTDTTNGVACTAETDELNYCVITGATGTSLLIRSLGLVVGHPQSWDLTAAIATAAGQDVTATLSGGGQTTTLGNATATTAAQPVTAVLGAISTLLSVATAAAAAQHATAVLGGTSATLSPATGTGVAQSVTTVLGGITAALAAAVATGVAQPVTVSIGGSITVLTVAVGTSAAQSVTVTLGGLSVPLTVAIGTSTALDVSVASGVVVTLPAAVASGMAQPVTAVLGVLAVALGAASSVAAAQNPSVVLGGLSASLAAAMATANGQPVTATVGGSIVALAAALAAAAGQSVTATIGGVQVNLTPAIGAGVARNITTTHGGITVPVGVAVATARAQDVTILTIALALDLLVRGTSGVAWQVICQSAPFLMAQSTSAVQVAVEADPR